MKKLTLTVCLVLGLLFMVAAEVPADTLIVNQGPYSYSNGGEFVVTQSGLGLGNYASSTLYSGGFATFCVEESEVFYPGTTYAFTKSDRAISGGVGPVGDPISLGTAWLYSQFAQGTLSLYNYSTPLDRKNDAGALQAAIWMLEDEMAWNSSNKFINLLLTTTPYNTEAGAKAPANGAYGVIVLNLWDKNHPGDYNYRVQDQLYVTPEPGILILLGIAMSAIGMAVPFVRKI